MAYGEILAEHFLTPQAGFIELPTRPGLGLELNEEAAGDPSVGQELISASRYTTEVRLKGQGASR